LVNTTLLKVKRYDHTEQVLSELWGATCYVGSHSVTCHPTQVNTPYVMPSRQLTQQALVTNHTSPLHTRSGPRPQC